MTGCIYKITSTITGKSYIGKTTRPASRRWASHKSRAKNGSRSHFHNAIRKYGVSAWEHKVLLSNIPVLLLDVLECEFIKTYNMLVDGYNSTEGGGGTVGNKLAKEHIEILRATHKGNSYGKGWKPTEEQKAKQRKALTGQVRSAETKKLLSENKLGLEHHNSKPANIYKINTDEVVAENVALREWCRDNTEYNAGALGRTARGKAIQHKGLYAVYTISYENVES